MFTFAVFAEMGSTPATSRVLQNGFPVSQKLLASITADLFKEYEHTNNVGALIFLLMGNVATG